MTDLPAAGTFTSPSRTNDEAKAAQDTTLAFIRQLPGTMARSTLSIASGLITPTRGQHDVDTESAAAADDLTNIATTNLPDGSLLRLHCVNAGRVVTVKHAAGGAGAVALAAAADFALDATSKWVLLQRSGTDWVEIDRYPALIAAASESAAGGAEIATQAEADLITDDSRMLTAFKAGLMPGYGVGFRNIAGRNGGLEVWQRGAGGAASIAVAASTTAYTADGWALKTNANQASVVDQVAGIATGSRWAARVRRNSGQTGTGTMAFEFPLDADEVVAMQGRKVTLALSLKAGANWSPTSGNILVELRTGTGSPAKRSAGAYTGDAADIAVTQAITTTATRFKFPSASALGAAITQASIYLTWAPTGTAGAADDFTIDDVQIEVGPAATAFERRPFESELIACQRHFWKTFRYDVAPAQNVGSPSADHQWGAQRAGALSNFGFLAFPVVMRVAPTITFFNPGAANAQARDLDVPGDCSSTSSTAFVRGVRYTTTGHASTAVGNTLAFHMTADAGI